MLNIVLLGGTGFVGSAMIRKLRDEKNRDIRIRALIRGDLDRIKSPSITTFEGELPHRIPRELFPDEPHVVVHFATKQIDSDNSGFYTANVEGTKKLLEAVPESAKGMIYGSSMSVYGQGEHRGIKEKQPVKPETKLAESRVEAEQLILNTMKNSNRTGFVLRPRFILGKGDRYTLKGFKTIAKKGLVVGSGKQSFSIIDVDDYAEIIIRLARSVMKRSEEGKPASRPINIGYENPVSFEFILKEIRKVEEIRKAGGFGLPWKKIPVFKLLTSFLRALPISAAGSLATKLELVGLSHSGNVGELEHEIGTDITGKNSEKVFAEILTDSYQ